MAMRPTAPTTSRPRATVRPVYDDFRPPTEWKQEGDADNLIIHLPGFLKEQLKITTEGRNNIRVRGERLMSGNKWNRFQEDFEAPENCNMRGIRAKFENGILTITMPRKPQPSTPAEDKTTHEPQKTPEHRPTRSQEAIPPPPPPTAQQRTQFEPQKRAPSEALKEVAKTGEKAEAKTGEIAEAKAAEKAEVKQTDRKTIDSEKGAPSEGRKEETVKTGEKAGAKTGEDYHSTGSGYKLENYKQAMQSLAKGQLNDERQLMANMGIAVLVLVAFGAYLSYTFGSSGKENQ